MKEIVIGLIVFVAVMLGPVVARRYAEWTAARERRGGRTGGGIYIGSITAGPDEEIHVSATGGGRPRVSIKAGKLRKAQKARLRIKDGTVYNVNDLASGRSELVFAVNADEARLVASKSLQVEEDALEAIEVYERVVRK